MIERGEIHTTVSDLSLHQSTAGKVPLHSVNDTNTSLSLEEFLNITITNSRRENLGPPEQLCDSQPSFKGPLTIYGLKGNGIILAAVLEFALHFESRESAEPNAAEEHPNC